MTRPLLILRPQPGADETAGRVRAIGLEAVVSPLFRIVRREWTPPNDPFDALLVTSANAARAIDSRIDRGMPIYAVGERTGAALAAAGFGRVTIGGGSIACSCCRRGSTRPTSCGARRSR